MMFHATDYDGDIAADGSETLDLRWFRPDALPAMLENMRRSVAAYVAFTRTGAFQMI